MLIQHKAKKLGIFSLIFILSPLLFVILLTMIALMFISDLFLQVVVKTIYSSINFVPRFATKEPMYEWQNGILSLKTYSIENRLISLFKNQKNGSSLEEFASALRVTGKISKVYFLRNMFLSPFVLIAYALSGIADIFANTTVSTSKIPKAFIFILNKGLETTGLKPIGEESKCKKEVYQVIDSFRERSLIVIRTISCLSKKNKFAMREKVGDKLARIIKYIVQSNIGNQSREALDNGNFEELPIGLRYHPIRPFCLLSNDKYKYGKGDSFFHYYYIQRIIFWIKEKINKHENPTSESSLSYIEKKLDGIVESYLREECKLESHYCSELFGDCGNFLAKPETLKEDILDLIKLISLALDNDNPSGRRSVLAFLSDRVHASDSYPLDLADYFVRYCLNKQGLAICATLSDNEVKSRLLEPLFNLKAIVAVYNVQMKINDIIQKYRRPNYKRELAYINERLKSLDKNKLELYDQYHVDIDNIDNTESFEHLESKALEVENLDSDLEVSFCGSKDFFSLYGYHGERDFLLFRQKQIKEFFEKDSETKKKATPYVCDETIPSSLLENSNASRSYGEELLKGLQPVDIGQAI